MFQRTVMFFHDGADKVLLGQADARVHCKLKALVSKKTQERIIYFLGFCCTRYRPCEVPDSFSLDTNGPAATGTSLIDTLCDGDFIGIEGTSILLLLLKSSKMIFLINFFLALRIFSDCVPTSLT